MDQTPIYLIPPLNQGEDYQKHFYALFYCVRDKEETQQQRCHH